MTPWKTLLDPQPAQTSIAPLFWQHGESESVLRHEIAQMYAKGIRGFIVESRPHPDFLGARWWQDLDILFDEARRRSMRVWVFDDSTYPSGFSGGRIKDGHPELLKIYLAERHIDPIGPLSGSSFFIGAWLEEGEALVRVLAARRTDGVDRFDAATLVNLTGRVTDGVLYWDVPEGDWRIFILVSTRRGGEEWTRDYLNPLLPEATHAYLDYVYEPHYRRYAADFGKTFAGFFSDEPRFGNASTYEATLGKYAMALPYAPGLLDTLSRGGSETRPYLGDDFGLYLPCLWYDGGPQTSAIRYAYMDEVSRAFGVHFSQKIGDWCRAHGVQLIGHIVEDNGAHARLGYGPGHFFRAISGQDVSGLDIVYQVWPEYSSGRFTTPFGYLDADFFYWGLAKMASSAGHIDPKKHGVTVCEVFGAYGWQEGLKLMKWLTDFICVRGVNFIIPHAFSPKDKDPDCPPHFYARGLNPQWPYFQNWSAYANRLCRLLSGGTHIAPLAVLYHAEAEWSGEYEPFEKVVKTLAEQQIDCDVLPADTLVDKEARRIEGGCLFVNQETYRALVVPYAQRLPEKLIQALSELAEAGLPVFFMRGLPESSSQNSALPERLQQNVQVCTHKHLVERLQALHIQDVEVSCRDGSETRPYLRCYHYLNQGTHLYFFTNESRSQALRTQVSLPHGTGVVGYDAMQDQVYRLAATSADGATIFELDLEPYESLFVIFTGDAQDEAAVDRPRRARMSRAVEISEKWQVNTVDLSVQSPLQGLGNVARPGILPHFSGTLRYETTFSAPETAGRTGRVLLDLGEVYEIAEVRLNGQPVGTRICPPYFFDITPFLERTEGGSETRPYTLQVDVTNTLAKAFGAKNVFDRGMSQEPSGLLGPVRLLLD